jgi:hypothetical protein
VTRLFRIALLIITIPSAPAPASADALDDAFTLLRLTHIDQQFAAARDLQVRGIIRTYSLILREQADIQLPRSIEGEIFDCYERSYNFANFRIGIAEILVDTFSDKELELLKDFHSDLGLPPSAISEFREIVAKAELVRTIGAEYIFNNTEGCVEQGTNLVMEFLKSQKLNSD